MENKAENYSQFVKEFLECLQNRESSTELKEFYHKDARQIEYPNAIIKETAIRSLKEILEGADRGKKLLAKEHYELIRQFAFDEVVIIEVKWTGKLAIPLGKLKEGDEMTAHFAQFYEFRDGKIFRQRNYDCFNPF